MKYTLLTGATGLLGRYIMRDLLLRNVPVAVLARDSKLDQAAARIDAILAYWEDQWGRTLPRPVVVTGDICLPGLALSADQREWVARHCDSILHVAASLCFEQKGEEPRRSNVGGVRNVLDFCRDTGIGILRHVSSAYTCGLRTGVVYENELFAGQQFGNIYEETKAEGERLVQEADFLTAYTIFRPTIIVGDSETGFTSNYHGFYAPLRPLTAISTYLPHEEVFALNHLEILGLQGHEGKNFVPVQWVSDALLTILERRADDNTTYALSSGHPVGAQRTYDLFQEAVRRFSAPAGNRNGEKKAAVQMDMASPEFQALVTTYLERLDVYRNYWRDDPTFNNRNTQQVIPDKPAPQLTDEDLLRLCKFAIENNFAWRPRRLPAGQFLPQAAIAQCQEHLARAPSAGVPHGTLTLTVTGDGGGSWTLRGRGDHVQCEPGRLEAATEVRVNATTFAALWDGRLAVDDAIARARMLVTGQQQNTDLLQALLTAGATATRATSV